ncbi:hypothetical protein ADUPG1_000516, partial [Aduncisulcus paluster]
MVEFYDSGWDAVWTDFFLINALNFLVGIPMSIAGCVDKQDELQEVTPAIWICNSLYTFFVSIVIGCEHYFYDENFPEEEVYSGLMIFGIVGTI